MAKIDLTGQRFGRLTVICDAGRNRGHVLWRCACSCGNETIVFSQNLRSGKTRSCGCEHAEKARRRWLHRHKANPSPYLSDRYEGGSIEDLEDLIR